MRLITAVSVLLLLSVRGIAADADELIGTWRLVSYQCKLVATGETEEIFGKNPHGYITYGRDGRMMVLIASGRRPRPGDLEKLTDQERADLFRTMISYAGTYTFDGNTVTHHIDISWNEVSTGTHQVRNVKLDGNRLTLSTNPQPRPQDGKMAVNTLVWEKMK